jgi:putative DNA primase/helicase
VGTELHVAVDPPPDREVAPVVQLRPWEWSDPLAIANRFASLTEWQRWRGGWYRLGDDGWYEERPEELVRSDLYQMLDAVKPAGGKDMLPTPPKQHSVSAVLDALKSVVLYDGEAPGWLPYTDDELPADELVVVANGLLHLPTRRHIVCGQHPALFTLTGLPFNYDAEATCPRWLEFLEKTWASDPASIAALQEWFGYVISGRTDLEKILLLWGPRRSGKGTVAAVAQALVGDGNHGGTTLANLGRPFGVASLIGKTLAVIGDARLGQRDPSEIVERLLSISGRDVQTVPRKYQSDWTGRLGVRFTILTNELPKLGDASGTVASRFVVLRTARSHEGEEDLKLRGRLLAEAPGILNWALDGLARLDANGGRFSTPESMAEDVEELHDLASPVGLFVREQCVVGEGLSIRTGDLFDTWRVWAGAQGYRWPEDSRSFGRDLRAVCPSVVRARVRTTTGFDREYRGIALAVPVSPTFVPVGVPVDVPLENRL